MVDDLETISHGYYIKPATDAGCQERQQLLRTKIHQIARKSNKFQKNHAGCYINSAIVILRQSITSGDFDSPTREAKIVDDQIFLKITNACSLLVGKLERCYSDKYRRK